jgi:3-dehydrosphinganine reductase
MSKRSLAGRRVVITGGSSGLGLAVAKLAAARGARVDLLARDARRLAEAREAVMSAAPGIEVGIHSADVSNAAALAHVFGEIGEFDVLVTSAGILTEGRFDQQDPEVFRAMVETNFFGTVACVREALPALKRNGGQITIVASVAGLLGVYGYSAYAASKHALIGFADSLRFELERDGVSVNVVCPGEFDSPMVDQLDSQRSPENRAHVLFIPKSETGPVADGVIAAIERDQVMTVPGIRAKMSARMGQLFPATSRAVGNLVVRRAARDKSDQARNHQ